MAVMEITMQEKTRLDAVKFFTYPANVGICTKLVTCEFNHTPTQVR